MQGKLIAVAYTLRTYWHDIRLVFKLPPSDSTLPYKRCVHLWNNFPCMKSLTTRISYHPVLHYIVCMYTVLLVLAAERRRFTLNKPEFTVELVGLLPYSTIMYTSLITVNSDFLGSKGKVLKVHILSIEG